MQTAEELSAEVERLRAAIIKHRSQKADDRCIEDDDELYAALGDSIKCDRRVGDKIAMLQNCARFIERRCEGGGWPSYAELEAQRDEAREGIRAAHRVLDQYNVQREDEVHEGGGVYMVTEYPVWNRITILVEALAYAPGEWFCPKCSFRLHKRVLSASTGDVGIDASTEPDLCPNDGTPMERLTWRQDAGEANKIAMNLFKELERARERINELEPVN